MLPLLDSVSREMDLFVFRTTDNVRGVIVELHACDIEREDQDLFSERLTMFMRTLSPKILVRVITRCERLQNSPEGLSRAHAIKELHTREYQTYLSVQSVPDPLSLIFPLHKRSPQTTNVIQTLTSFKDLGFKLQPLGESETKEFFIKKEERWVLSNTSIETGVRSIGLIRLTQTSSHSLTPEMMANVLKELPVGSEISISIRKVDPAKAEILLQKRIRQEKSSDERLSLRKEELLDDALSETSLNGVSLLEFEFLVTMKALTERELREKLSSAKATLKHLGEVSIETVGLIPSFVASRIGCSQHVTLFETDQTLPMFLPVWRRGETEFRCSTAGNKYAPAGAAADPLASAAADAHASAETSEQRGSGLLAHRIDHSYTVVDLLNQKNQNSNAVIVGASGRGKSVFLGCLTQSLLNDPNVQVIKVDVGGSHSKECDLLGGREFKLSMDHSSGLNPFALATDDSEFSRAVLGQFLEVLIREEGELRLSKKVRSEIDQSLSSYLAGKRKVPSLTDFYEAAPNFPRRELLGRWSKDGIYGKAFEASDEGFGAEGSSVFDRNLKRTDSRLIYLNLSQIFQASDAEFAQAVMAAVLAVFNLAVIRSQTNGRRSVLVCDETPFFIDRCFEFFKFSTANVRKFGAAVILVVQNSQHLVVGGDTSVIENSHHRFLFSHDGRDEEFRERLNLTKEQFERLKNLRLHSGKSSELLYLRGDDAQVLNLRLTPEEYWRVTSSTGDRLKLEGLLREVPGLTLKEAIRCLASQ